MAKSRRKYKRPRTKKARKGTKSKVCRSCPERGPLTLSSFGNDRTAPDGLKYNCKQCEYNYQKSIQESRELSRWKWDIKNVMLKLGVFRPMREMLKKENVDEGLADAVISSLRKDIKRKKKDGA